MSSAEVHGVSLKEIGIRNYAAEIRYRCHSLAAILARRGSKEGGSPISKKGADSQVVTGC
jgi:hypothetical protein